MYGTHGLQLIAMIDLRSCFEEHLHKVSTFLGETSERMP